MSGYVYRGTEHDVHEPLSEPKPRGRRITGPAKCGTRSGYTAHRKANEDACQPCKDANQAYNVDYAQRVKARLIKKGWDAGKCGTLAGHRAHYRHGVPVCEPCRAANATSSKDRREAKRAA